MTEVSGTLLSEPFVTYWTNKWADLLQVNSKFLGKEGATALRQWIQTQVEENTPYDQFCRQILTAEGSNKENPAASYYKILRQPDAMMENTTRSTERNRSEAMESATSAGHVVISGTGS